MMASDPSPTLQQSEPTLNHTHLQTPTIQTSKTSLSATLVISVNSSLGLALLPMMAENMTKIGVLEEDQVAVAAMLALVLDNLRPQVVAGRLQPQVIL